jgi:hypothetical protein
MMKATKKQLMQAVEMAIEEMNFEKIRTSMENLEWGWIRVDGTPSKEQMIEHIKDLAKTAIWTIWRFDRSSYVARSDGFEVEVWDATRNNGPSASVAFVIDWVFHEVEEEEEDD